MSLVTLFVRLVTAIASFSFLVLCDSTTHGGFIFPYVSNPDIPGVFDFTVRNNDNMIVSFNLVDATEIGLGFNCTVSIQDAINSEQNRIGGGEAWTILDPCECFL